jgi:hypothetical protein
MEWWCFAWFFIGAVAGIAAMWFCTLKDMRTLDEQQSKAVQDRDQLSLELSKARAGLMASIADRVDLVAQRNEANAAIDKALDAFHDLRNQQPVIGETP